MAMVRRTSKKSACLSLNINSRTKDLMNSMMSLLKG